MNALWSWALTIVGVLGIYLTTRKLWAGYVVGIAAQALWVAYAVATGQWGFIASAVAYGLVYGLGWYRWTRPTKDRSPIAAFVERARVSDLREGDTLCDANGETIGTVVEVQPVTADLNATREFMLLTMPFAEPQSFELSGLSRVWRQIAGASSSDHPDATSDPTNPSTGKAR